MRSNFASSGATGELVDVLEQPVSVPAVQRELERGHEQQYGFLENALDCLGDDVPLLELGNGGAETAELGERLDSGEARALAGAAERDGTLATDNLAARRTAFEYDVPVTGSAGSVEILFIRHHVE